SPARERAPLRRARRVHPEGLRRPLAPLRPQDVTVIRAAWVALVVVALPAAAAGSAPRTAWEQWVHVPGVVDVAGPRSDGRMVVAARGRLLLLGASGKPGDFASSYAVPDGTEPYITVSPGLAVDGAGCS